MRSVWRSSEAMSRIAPESPARIQLRSESSASASPPSFGGCTRSRGMDAAQLKQDRSRAGFATPHCEHSQSGPGAISADERTSPNELVPCDKWDRMYKAMGPSRSPRRVQLTGFRLFATATTAVVMVTHIQKMSTTKTKRKNSISSIRLILEQTRLRSYGRPSVTARSPDWMGPGLQRCNRPADTTQV